MVSTGFAYDSSATDAASRTLAIPFGQSYRIAAGIEWFATDVVGIGVAYSLVWYGDLSVNQQGTPLNGDVVGEYPRAALHNIALNFNFRLRADSRPDWP